MVLLLLGYLIEIYGPTPINIIHSESPGKLFFRSPARCDVKSEHELPEVNSTAIVGVEGSEDILAEFVGITTGEHLAVHGHKLVLGQFSTGTILKESLVPFQYLLCTLLCILH